MIIMTTVLYLCWLFGAVFAVRNSIERCLLNRGSMVHLELESFFSQPSQATIDYDNSTHNIHQFFDIQLTQQPRNNKSSIELSGTLSNKTIYFSSLELVEQKSVFNEPIKLFLMKSNILFTVVYQFISSDNSTTDVQVVKVATASQWSCQEMEVLDNNGTNYLIVACRGVKNNKTLLQGYRFIRSSVGRPTVLTPLSNKITLDWYCSRLTLYPFMRLCLRKKCYFNSIIILCPQTSGTYNLTLLNVTRNKNNTFTLKSTILPDPDLIPFYLRDSSYVVQYRQGLLTYNAPYLFYVSYAGKNSLTRSTLLKVTDPMFFVSVRQRKGAQFIYIISQSRILIKEDYATNYQILNINGSLIRGVTLTSYAITQKMLTLLYVNAKEYLQLVYDLTEVYPKLIDTFIESNKDDGGTSLLSVNNFLQTGNYYLTINLNRNLMSLTYYEGYELTATPKDATVGDMMLVISDCLESGDYEQLAIQLIVRDWEDTTLLALNNLPTNFTLGEGFSIEVGNYMLGPLAHFFNYPNNLSAIQHINYYSQAQIQDHVEPSPIAISANNILNEAVLSFYYLHETSICFLHYNNQTQFATLSDCNHIKVGRTQISDPSGLIVLSQTKYLQHDNSTLELCALASSGDTECQKQNYRGLSLIGIVKVTNYYVSNTAQSIFMIIYNTKEIIYCSLEKEGMKNFSFLLHYKISDQQLPWLEQMQIRHIYLDKGYQNFLILHAERVTLDEEEDEYKHRVVVYGRADIQPDSASDLIGQAIYVFQLLELEGIFCVGNKLILLLRGTAEEAVTIRQYVISNHYSLTYRRSYPLYHYRVQIGGRHFQDGNYIFLSDQDQHYLVYSPQAPVLNVLSHRLPRNRHSGLLFAQQLGETNNNSIGLNGHVLFGLSLPSLVFQFQYTSTPSPKHPPAEAQFTFYDVNVSVMDLDSYMQILTYQLLYDEFKEIIEFNGDSPITIKASTKPDPINIELNPADVLGPVDGYRLEMDSSSCNGAIVEQSDIFNEQQCLLYHNYRRFGSVDDFMSIDMGDIDEQVELVATDVALICVRNRRLPYGIIPNWALTECEFNDYHHDAIIMTCFNSSSGQLEIYNVTVRMLQHVEECEYDLKPIKIASWFQYQDFQVLYSQGFILLEAPIRYQKNKIYYKAELTPMGMDESKYSILTRNPSESANQAQFMTVDTSAHSGILLMLQDGLGVYNLSNNKETVAPALWIYPKDLPNNIGGDELVYVKYINLTEESEFLMIEVEMGTKGSSYEMVISVSINQNLSTNQQTVYQLKSIKVVYEYAQYSYCHNSRLSHSQRHGHLVVKICQYEPPDLRAFGRFASISNDSSRPLIQFYLRQTSSSHPFRMETIHSDLHPTHNLQIRGDTLISASPFNLLCYYHLSSNISWRISYPTNRTQTHSDTCSAKIVMYNLRHTQTIPITITYDDGRYNQWSNWLFYIQRVIILAVLVNSIRLIYRETKTPSRSVLRKRSAPGGGGNRLHLSRFEVLVKMNSKKSIELEEQA